MILPEDCLGLPKDLPATTEPGSTFGVLDVSAGFCPRLESVLEPVAAGAPVDRLLPEVFRDVLPPLLFELILAPTEPFVAGCLDIAEERVSVVRGSRVPEGFLAVVEGSIRDDFRVSRGLLKLVPFRLGFLVVGIVLGVGVLIRAVGSFVVVDVVGFLVVICLPIRERELRREASFRLFVLVVVWFLCPKRVTDCRDVAEFED